ncbi:ATP-dependent Clp endopeptidase, proteolytic subunit ClpP [Chitinophaga jiangningensis]|uniref:ATP-dependent Clp protease proteolytic subunit n=1 Tax=Chitinophaga jiangningensis TaxID=1419482 RepID=A0A1M6WGV1_9BACT|nr:head maturation protease, ClpP-related [Chitinophaga jiangningensis]SHK92745.1 ATP-dependent Clp endopeptidase, proteolytic subunit ClpP [Chitinophaga jiangningensis]
MKRPVQVFNYRIQNNSNSHLDIYIDGAIVDAETQEIYEVWFGDTTSVSFKSIREQINAANPSSVKFHVNSPGGSVTDAMAIYDYMQQLKRSGVKVDAIGIGLVASAGTYIVMGGEVPALTPNTWWMVHNASGWAWGDVNEVERQAATLRKFNNQIRDFYCEATGLSEQEITAMMDAETWMTAEEAVAKGFVKEVDNLSTSNVTNKVTAEPWGFKNKAGIAAYNSALVTQPPFDLQQILLTQNNDMKNFLKNFLEGFKGNFKPAENATTEDIRNQLADALEKSLGSLETEVTNLVTEQVNSMKSNIINEIKGVYDDKITTLTNKATELESEIANKIGQKTTAQNSEVSNEGRGKFNKAE